MKSRPLIKKIFFALLILLSIGFVLFLYVDRIFLPVKIKKMIVTNAEEYLGRHVSVGDIHFNFLNGLIINDFQVAPKGIKQTPFIQVEQISLSVPFTPLLKGKKLIVSKITLTKPFVQIYREENNQWNFSDLIDKFSTPAKNKKGSPGILMRKMVVQNGQINYVDKTPIEDFIEIIREINLSAQINIDQTIIGSLTAKIPKQKSLIKADGEYHFLKKTASGNIVLNNVPLFQYLTLYRPDWDSRQGLLSQAKLNIKYTPGEFDIKGNLDFNNIDLLYNNKIILKGSFKTPSFSAQFNKNQWTGQGQMTLTNFIFDDQDHFIQGELQGAMNQFKWDSSGWETQAHFSLSKGEIKWGPEFAFKGDLTADKTDLSQKAGIINLKADCGLTDAFLKIGDQQTYQGQSLSMRNLILSSDRDQWRVNADVQGNNLSLAIGEKNTLQGNLVLPDFSFSKDKDKILVESRITLNDAIIQLGPDNTIKGNITAEPMKLTLDKGRLVLDTELQLLDGYIRTMQNKVFLGDLLAKETRLTYQKKAFNIKTNAQLNNGEILLDPNIKFKGSPLLEILLTYDPTRKDKIIYNGKGIFQNSVFTGLPQIETIQNIKGEVSFKTNQLNTEDLHLNLLGSEITLSGILTDFKKPLADLSASVKALDLDKIKPFVPQDMLKKTDYDLTGQADIDLSFKGLVQKPQNAEISATALLTKGLITSPEKTDFVQNISGKISYQKDLLIWHDLQARFQDKDYTLNGQIMNFSRPILETTVKEKNLSFSTRTKILNQAFTIVSLTGNYWGSTFDIAGEIHLENKTSPYVDLKGLVHLDLKNLPIELIPPSYRPQIEKADPQGLLSIEGLYRGHFKNPRSWEMAFKLQSPKIWLYKHPIHDLLADYGQRDHNVEWELKSSLYGGTLEVRSSADLTKALIPAKLSIGLKNFDLAVLRRDNKIKQKRLAGKLSLTVNSDGPLKDPDQWQGQGSAVIIDGFLGQLIPRVSDAVFTGAAADFSIEDRKIYTDNAKITSPHINLNVRGWVDFNQNINFDIYPHVNDLELVETDGLKIDPSALLTRAVHIKLTGTIEKPVKEINASASSIIEDTLGTTSNILRGGLGTILNEVF